MCGACACADTAGKTERGAAGRAPPSLAEPVVKERGGRREGGGGGGRGGARSSARPAAGAAPPARHARPADLDSDRPARRFVARQAIWSAPAVWRRAGTPAAPTRLDTRRYGLHAVGPRSTRGGAAGTPERRRPLPRVDASAGRGAPARLKSAIRRRPWRPTGGGAWSGSLVAARRRGVCRDCPQSRRALEVSRSHPHGCTAAAGGGCPLHAGARVKAGGGLRLSRVSTYRGGGCRVRLSCRTGAAGSCACMLRSAGVMRAREPAALVPRLSRRAVCWCRKDWLFVGGRVAGSMQSAGLAASRAVAAQGSAATHAGSGPARLAGRP